MSDTVSLCDREAVVTFKHKATATVTDSVQALQLTAAVHSYQLHDAVQQLSVLAHCGRSR
jgi:hypothetical protein